MRNRLEARVKAQNTANAIAMKVFDALVDVFAEFEGKKVLKADGSLLKKVDDLVKAAMPQLPDDRRINVYRNSSNYTISYTVNCCEMVPDTCTCVYQDATVYIADLSGQKIEKLYDKDYRPTDYDADDIERKRLDYKEKKRIADEALSALFPFGEYDR